MPGSWTRAVVRARVPVLALWAAVVVLGALAAGQVGGRLTTTLSVPGTSSAAADAVLVRHFDDNVEGTFLVVVAHPGAPTAARVARAAVSLGLHVGQSRTVDGVLFASLTSRAGLARAAATTPALRAALARGHVRGATVTGPPALQHDLTPILTSDLRRGEWVALVVALALLLVALGLCGALAVPLVVAAATIAGAVGLVDLLARATTMVLYAPNVAELVGLGLAVDYSLLIVHRYRAESERDPEGALATAMATAGRTVAWSAGVVALGCAALLLAPVPLLRSLGLAALTVPVAACLAALTLAPALLSALGARGVRPVGPRGLFAADAARGIWARAARVVTARPRAALCAALVVLGACASGLALFSLTPASTSAIPASMESARALSLVSSRVGPGAATPLVVVVDAGSPGRATSPPEARAITALATAISRDPDVAIAAVGDRAPFVDATRRYAQVLAVPRGAFGAPSTRALVARVRADLARARMPAGTRLWLGGAPAQGADFLDRVYGAFPWIAALTLALALVALARAFRSVVAAALAVVLDLASVAAAYGLTALVFATGLGHRLLGTYRAPQLEGWVPVVVFAVLFGLSSDYEVFIVSRVREARERGASPREAVVEGVAATGAVVTVAAAIMVGALAGLAFGRVAGLQELGVGLAAGVALDATVVRGVALPAALTLLGPAAGWRPGRGGALARERAT